MPKLHAYLASARPGSTATDGRVRRHLAWAQWHHLFGVAYKLGPSFCALDQAQQCAPRHTSTTQHTAATTELTAFDNMLLQLFSRGMRVVQGAAMCGLAHALPPSSKRHPCGDPSKPCEAALSTYITQTGSLHVL